MEHIDASEFVDRGAHPTKPTMTGDSSISSGGAYSKKEEIIPENPGVKTHVGLDKHDENMPQQSRASTGTYFE